MEERSRAILDTDETAGQVASAATVTRPSAINGDMIRATEAEVQQSFVRRSGVENALITPSPASPDFQFEHFGEVPIHLLRNR